MSLTLSRAGRSVVAFSPAALPGLAFTLHPTLSRAQGKLWQDAAKTIPVVNNGDVVQVATCPYTGVDFEANKSFNRPTLFDEGGGKWSLLFDGVDDYLRVMNTSLGQPTSRSVSAAWRAQPTATDGSPISRHDGTQPQWYFLLTGGDCRFVIVATAGVEETAATPCSIADHYVIGWSDSNTVNVQKDGGTVATLVDGTPFANNPSSALVETGAADFGSAGFAGRIRFLTLATTDWDAATRLSLNTFMAGL